ncbi:MAG: hypothetical protein AB9917_20080 [Negativicutes bacterium]
MTTKRDEWLTTKEFAVRFSVTPETAANYCNSKKWRIHRLAKKEGGRWLINWTRVYKFCLHPATS